ncbi:amidohydrolase [Metallumcola ferriviriculae]|uniref:Amidohydrolase n=1 Tax=Metallumcola ferriviriculae TaxID=3039180 RepID=A0AAU0UTI7_9FIRM|nr:amidohydrolase [Desulfitibacteraceae bacterium MK1]
MDISREVTSHFDELVALRRDFHKHPELGFEEYRTSDIIVQYLKDLGIEAAKVAKTGVVGLLKGSASGRTLMLRADIDALAVQEMTELPFKSVYQGASHACGHDGHTAILLVAAKILAKHKELIKGNIKFIFEPCEETAGAMAMINEGVLTNPAVDAALGLHLWAPIDSGKIGVVPGPVMAACEEFELTIIGKGGHTSTPQTAVDPIMAACQIVQNMQVIQTRLVDARQPTTIMFGKINGGTGRNIIPEQVQMGGTIRFLYENEDEGKRWLQNKFEEIVSSVCTTMGAQYKLTYIPSNPAIINDVGMAKIVAAAAEETLGSPGSVVSELVMAGDDFAEFSRRIPSAFYFVGTGNKEKGTNYPHHHPCFNIDEDTLATGLEMHLRTALAFFEG